MEQFGVGRPTIREALFSLEKMGLIALASGKSHYTPKQTKSRPPYCVAKNRLISRRSFHAH